MDSGELADNQFQILDSYEIWRLIMNTSVCFCTVGLQILSPSGYQDDLEFEIEILGA